MKNNIAQILNINRKYSFNLFFVLIIFAYISGCSDWGKNQETLVTPKVTIAKQESKVWKKFEMPADVVSFYPEASNKILFGTPGGAVYLSNDNGNTWNKSTVDQTDPGIFRSYITISINQVANKKVSMFAASDKGVFQSTDNGKNWSLEKYYPSLALPAEINGIIEYPDDNVMIYGKFGPYDCFGCSLVPLTPSWSFYGLFGKDVKKIIPSKVYSNYYLYIKKDTLGSYVVSTKLNNTVFLGSLKATSIANDLSDNIYVGTNDGLYVSKNQGKSFSFCAFKGIEISGLCVNSLGVVFIGTDKGLFSSNDLGANWVDISPEDGNSVSFLKISSDGYLYLGTKNKKYYCIFTDITDKNYPPLLMSPKNNSIGAESNPTLSWVRWNYEMSAYVLQVAIDSTFTNGIIINQKWVEGSSYTLKDLSPQTIYYWRMRRINIIFQSEWSEI